MRELVSKIPWPLGQRSRNLRRELKEQSTEEYWRQRERSRLRGLRVISHRYRLESFAHGTQRNLGIFRDAFFQLLRAFCAGALLFAAVLLAEFFLAAYVWPDLVPSGQSAPPLSAFPTLAVQVSASLLGFYLAGVSVVLGTSYHNVSAEVRYLVLGNPRVRLYLASVGMAIGAGLTLVFLQSLAIPYGYLSVIAYGLMVIFGGWSFVQLAFGAFNLFNPIVLGQEPILSLYRTINRIDGKGLNRNEAVLRATALEASRSLRLLAELIDLTKDRGSVDRRHLANMVSRLLALVKFYSQKKHMLAPSSAWFLQEPVYPKWVEASDSEVSIALKTSTPLQPRLEPSTDWLERRTAELTAAAIEACVAANDRDSVILITNEVSATTRALAMQYRIDDAIAFSAIVKNRCWNIRTDNHAAVVASAVPPMFLADLLLGWREAISNWPDEIQATVDATKWDRKSTSAVQIRGSSRVWAAAQELLNQVQAEHDIQGRRVTPDWYLRLALADACILSLREFARELPRHLDEFLSPSPAHPSPEVNVMTGSQALMALARVQLVTDTLPQAAEGLELLRMENDRQEVEEFQGLDKCIKTRRAGVLRGIANALIRLQPEQSKAEPDLFGAALFTLIHHTEEAIADGDVALVKEVFPKVLSSTFVLQEYVLATYLVPAQQVNSALLDPTIDILELSGLAMIYATLRDDQSDTTIRQAWTSMLNSLPGLRTDVAARLVLDRLETAENYSRLGITQRDIARTGWERRLLNQIVEAGYATPAYNPFGNPQPRNAPPLIKMLGILDRGGPILLKPYAIFAAEVIAPLSAETEELLRKRRALRIYYDQKDFQGRRDSSSDHYEEMSDNKG